MKFFELAPTTLFRIDESFPEIRMKTQGDLYGNAVILNGARMDHVERETKVYIVSRLHVFTKACIETEFLIPNKE